MGFDCQRDDSRYLPFEGYQTSLMRSPVPVIEGARIRGAEDVDSALAEEWGEVLGRQAQHGCDDREFILGIRSKIPSSQFRMLVLCNT